MKTNLSKTRGRRGVNFIAGNSIEANRDARRDVISPIDVPFGAVAQKVGGVGRPGGRDALLAMPDVTTPAMTRS
jgi:hypothetical protein